LKVFIASADKIKDESTSPDITDTPDPAASAGRLQ